MALTTRLFSLHSDDGTDVRTVDADNAVFHLLFWTRVRFAGDTPFNASRRLLCSEGERDVDGVYFADSVPLPYLFGKQVSNLHRSLAVAALLCLRCLAQVSLARSMSRYLLRGSRSFSILQVFSTEIEATRSIPTTALHLSGTADGSHTRLFSLPLTMGRM